MASCFNTSLTNIMPLMRMYLLIATHGRPTLLGRTLSSVARCDRPTELAGIWLVENGGRHGAEQVLEDQLAGTGLTGTYRYVADGNKSGALNVALEELQAIDPAEDPLVVFLDDDVRLEAQVLTAYAQAARRLNPRSQCFFGGPTGVDYETPPADWVRGFLPASGRGWEAADPDAADLEFLGFNWAAYASDLAAVGGFDRRRGPGAVNGSTGQESEMQHRLRAAGRKPTYLPEAKVWHHVPADRCDPAWIIRRAYRNGVASAVRRSALPGGQTGSRCPVWVYGRRFKSFIRLALSRVVGGPPHRLRARVGHAYNRGLRDGFRQPGTPASAAGSCRVPDSLDSSASSLQ